MVQKRGSVEAMHVNLDPKDEKTKQRAELSKRLVDLQIVPRQPDKVEKLELNYIDRFSYG